jgi:hypothetical protein
LSLRWPRISAEVAGVPKVLFGPVYDDGTIFRCVASPDGRGRVEIWNPTLRSWEPSSWKVETLHTKPFPSDEVFERLGVPASDRVIATGSRRSR